MDGLGRELLHALDREQFAVAVIAAVAPRDIVQHNRPTIEEGAIPRAPGGVFGEPIVDTPEARLAENARWDPRLGTAEDFIAAVRYTNKPKGIAAEHLSAGQRTILVDLLRQYTDRLPEQLAAYHAAKFEGSALDSVHFAWAGGIERRQPHYYRIQGPRLLVEYDCTQDNANHIHSVWRDPVGDFGADMLAQHYALAH